MTADGPTHFLLLDRDDHNVWPCRADGSRERAPMRPSMAPPVCTLYWTAATHARYEQVALEGRRAFDAWHEIWAPRSFWDVDPKLVLREQKGP